MRRPSREQEVLHYQWFADLGSVEAQRAVGQIFSHGALRNPEQALRYFRSLVTLVTLNFKARSNGGNFVTPIHMDLSISSACMKVYPCASLKLITQK